MSSGPNLLLFCCLTGSWFAEAQDCGRPRVQEDRIVGGMDSSEGAWPWQVDIQMESGGHVCGGSIISESWILSAAHCFPNRFDISSYIVYAGRLQLNGVNLHQTSRRVVRVEVPPGYMDPHGGRDVALVELHRPLEWSDHIGPVCLPDTASLFPGGLSCVVTGWGNIRDQVPVPGVGTLQEVRVPIISQASCQQMYSLNPQDQDQDRIQIQSDMICAGFQDGGKDACQGDSGGPLVCQVLNGSWVQAGVVSFGLGCARPDRPGVYARVSAFAGFISGTVPGIRLYGGAGAMQGGVSLLCGLMGVLLLY